MSRLLVSVQIETADRTRRAYVKLPRDMRAQDVVKTCRSRWKLPRNVDYQIANMTKGSLILAAESLNEQVVNEGDTLMLQPLPTHGSN